MSAGVTAGVRVAILIVNYNSAQDVLGCVSSVVADTEHEFFVLDNASPNQDWDRLIRSFGGRSDVHLIASDTNVGFGGGMNILAAAALATEPAFLWILNPDTDVHPHALDVLVNTAVDEALDIVSPVLLTPAVGGRKPRVWFAGGELHRSSGESKHWHFGDVYKKAPTETAPVTFCTGAALLITAGAWKQLNGFREDFFLYWEDSDLSIRAVDAGLRMAVHPGAEVDHRQGGSSERSGISPTYSYYIQRNRLLLFADSTPARLRLLLRGPLVTLKPLLKAIITRDLESFRAGVAGIVDGFRSVHGPRPR